MKKCLVGLHSACLSLALTSCVLPDYDGGMSAVSNGGSQALGGSASTTSAKPTGGSNTTDSTAAGGTLTSPLMSTIGGATQGEGATASGGSQSTGAPAIGGVDGLGGLAATGGRNASGGSITAGGSDTGGTNAFGGASAPVVGGTTATGGTSAFAETSAAIGGTTASGGTSAATGGTSASGGISAATGGTSASGGISAATGGTSASGGISAATGGTSCNYSSTGGTDEQPGCSGSDTTICVRGAHGTEAAEVPMDVTAPVFLWSLKAGTLVGYQVYFAAGNVELLGAVTGIPPNPAAGTFQLAIYNNVNSAPGTLLAKTTDITSDGADSGCINNQSVTQYLDTPLQITTGRSYWIMILVVAGTVSVVTNNSGSLLATQCGSQFADWPSSPSLSSGTACMPAGDTVYLGVTPRLYAVVRPP